MTAQAAGDAIPPGCAVIEVQVAELRQLFNSIDPSPFQERDLDPRAEEFIVGRSRDLAIGLVVLAGTIALAQLVSGRGGGVGEVLHESLLIGGWVAMWRPLEVFLYEWWPIRADALLFDRLASMPVRISHPAAVPAGPTPSVGGVTGPQPPSSRVVSGRRRASLTGPAACGSAGPAAAPASRRST